MTKQKKHNFQCAFWGSWNHEKRVKFLLDASFISTNRRQGRCDTYETKSCKSAVNRSDADFTVFVKLRNAVDWTCAGVDAQTDGSIEVNWTGSKAKWLKLTTSESEIWCLGQVIILESITGNEKEKGRMDQ